MEKARMGNRVFGFFKYSLIALYPILGFYNGIWVLSLGSILLALIMIIEISMNGGRMEVNRNLFFVILFLSILNLICGLTFMNKIPLKGYLNNSLQMIEIGVLCGYFVKSSILNQDRFYKYLRALALISTFFLFAQLVLYSKGIVLYGFFPGVMTSSDYQVISIAYGRPNSFFLEPAHYAIYVLPIYALSLYKREYIVSIILLIGLVLSTSSTAIVIMAIITILYLFYERRLHLLIKGILLIIGLILAFQYLPEILKSEVMEKISPQNLKGNIRVFGSLKYFNFFQIKEYFIGVGINQLSNYMKIYGNTHVKNYANAFIFSFLSFGIIGGILWNGYVVHLVHKIKNKSLYLIFILICLTDQILFNRNLLYLLLILHVFSGDISIKKPSREV